MFERVPLSYALDALEPHIDSETMHYHYNKHYETYTKNFNDLLAKVPALAGKSAEYILSHLDEVPLELRTGIKNNGGGYLNHSQYFTGLSPNGGGNPTGSLAARINMDFGSADGLRDVMTKAAMGVFGSGYAWLIADNDGALTVLTTPNQDTPVNEGKLGVITVLDVWEHAYYLKHKNMRANYVAAFWNVLDWTVAAKRYDECVSK